MILPDWKIKEEIENGNIVIEEGIQPEFEPAGLVLRLKDLQIMDGRSFPIRSRIHRGMWEITCSPGIVMPKNLCAEIQPRSTIRRNGIITMNGFVDPGYCGLLKMHIEVTGTMFLPEGLLEPGSKVAQLVFHRLEENVQVAYDGQYQGEM